MMYVRAFLLIHSQLPNSKLISKRLSLSRYLVSFNLFRLPEIRFTKRPYYYGTVCLFAFKVTWLRNYDPQQVVLLPLDVEGRPHSADAIHFS